MRLAFVGGKVFLVAIVDVVYLKVDIFDCTGAGDSFLKTVIEFDGFIVAGLRRPARESVRLITGFFGADGCYIILGSLTVFRRLLVGIPPLNWEALAFLASASNFFSAIVFTAVLTLGRVLIGSFDLLRAAVPGLSTLAARVRAVIGARGAMLEVIFGFETAVVTDENWFESRAYDLTFLTFI